MTKTVYFLRHAKAENGLDKSDFERSLNDEGVAQAKELGGLMRDKGYEPAQFIVSPAKRTMDTFTNLGFDAKPDTNEKLYNGAGSDYLDAIQNADDGKDSVCVIGHNPSISDITRMLIVSGDDEMVFKVISGFKKGMFVAGQFEADHWKDIQVKSGTITDLILTD